MKTRIRKTYVKEKNKLEYIPESYSGNTWIRIMLPEEAIPMCVSGEPGALAKYTIDWFLREMEDEIIEYP